MIVWKYIYRSVLSPNNGPDEWICGKWLNDPHFAPPLLHMCWISRFNSLPGPGLNTVKLTSSFFLLTICVLCFAVSASLMSFVLVYCLFLISSARGGPVLLPPHLSWCSFCALFRLFWGSYCSGICHVIPSVLSSDRLVGLLVKASASRAEGPGFESRLRQDFFRGRVIPVT